jgi:SAM-dependent methyltransferase
VKPEHYEWFGEAFECFSNPFLTPQNQEFIDRLTDLLPKGASVVDVGGGTAIYTADLISMRSDLSLTFIEPSPENMRIARTRLDARNDLREATLDEVLPTLEPQDAFIFCRSLYALYGEIEPYRALFAEIREKLRPDGYVCVWDFYEKADLEFQYAYFKANLEDDPEMGPTFERLWPVLRRSLELLNEGVEPGGAFTLFSREILDPLMTEAGFETVVSEEFTHIYRVPAEKGPGLSEKLKGLFRRSR